MSRFELRHGAYIFAKTDLGRGAFAKTDLSKCNIVISVEGLQRKIVKIDGKITFLGEDFTYIWNLWKGGMYEIDNVHLYDNNVLKAVCTLIIDSDLDNYRKLGNGTLSVNSPYEGFKRAYEKDFNWLEVPRIIQRIPTQNIFVMCSSYSNFPDFFDQGALAYYMLQPYYSFEEYMQHYGGLGDVVYNFPNSSMYVRYNNAIYRCKSSTPIKGIPPTNSDYWVTESIVYYGLAQGSPINNGTFNKYTLTTPLVDYPEEVYVKRTYTQETVTKTSLLRDLRQVIDFFANKQSISFPYLTTTECYTVSCLGDLKLMLMDKSDAKRPEASQAATLNFMTFKTLLDELWNQFEIDWYIDNNRFSLIQKHDYYQNLTTGGIDLTPYTAGLTTFDFEPNRIVMEIWNFENSTAEWNQLINDFPVTGENKREISLTSVCNNTEYLKYDPSSNSDNGRTYVIVRTDNTLESANNHLCSPAGLRDMFLKTLRPRIATKDGYTFDSVDFDKIHAEIKIPHGIDIFSIDFFSFAKTTLSDKSLIYEASQSLKDGSVKIKCKFFELK